MTASTESGPAAAPLHRRRRIGLALKEIAGTLAQDAIAITGQERGDMLALAARDETRRDLVPRALAACPQTGGPKRR
jgi:hypothetical protein